MKKKLHKSRLAASAGISPSTLSNILSGFRRPSPRIAKQLEDASGVHRLVWLYSTPEEIKHDLLKAAGIVPEANASENH